MGCGGSKAHGVELATPAVAAAVEPEGAAASAPVSAVAAATHERSAIKMLSGEDRTTVVEKLRALFRNTDATGGGAEGDGKLTREELNFHLDRKEMKSLLHECGLLDEFDTDRDGKISIDELLDKMDTDGNGTISLAEYLNAVLNSDASPAAAAAASSTDSAIKTLLHDLEEISEEDQIDLQLKRMAATMAVADVAERQPVVSDLEMIAAKLQILFVKTDVDVGTAEAIRNSELTKQELQFNLNRGQMKKLLEDAGAVSKFDANADGKLSLDEILFHIDTDGNGVISLHEYLNAMLNALSNSGNGAGGTAPAVNDLDAAMNAIMDEVEGGGAAAAVNEKNRRTSAHSIFETEEDALEKELNNVQMSVLVETAGEAGSVSEQPMNDTDRTLLAMKLGGLFEKADATLNDGDLTSEELQYHLNRKEMTKLLEEAGHLEKFDGNADGKISIAEILEMMDTDDSGSISLEEFLRAALGGGKEGLANTKLVSTFSEHWV